MSNIFLLIKNYYKMFLYKLFKIKNKSFAFLIIIIFSISFIFLFTSLSYNTIVTAKSLGIVELALSSFSITILMFMFMLVISESSPIRKSNDEEFLLSLPFKKSHIVAAKVLYYLTFDLVIVLFLILPSYILYYVLVENVSWLLIARALYVIICATLFSTGISGIISSFLVKISKKFRYSDIINSLFSTILVISFVAVYFAFVFVGQDVSKASALYDLYPVRLFTNAIGGGDLASLVVITIIAMCLFIISILVRSNLLGKSASTYHTKNFTLTYKEQKVQKSLYKRELYKYFSIPIYVTNTIFGPLFMIVIALIITIIGKEYFINLIEMVISTGYEEGIVPENIITMINQYFSVGLIFILSAILAISPTTASAISLEGNELWILKAHPIDYKDVFMAKILVNITINGFPLLLAVILLASRIPLVYSLFCFLIPFLVIILSSISGLYINLSYPKLLWQSEQEVVKQGIAVVITMGVNFILVVLPMMSYFFLPFGEVLKLLVVVLVYIILIGISCLLLFKKGKALYERL